MKILAIETSCDETAISVLEVRGAPPAGGFRILSNIVSSQVKIHAKWGGVVPNLAKREHQKNLPLVLNKALKKAEILNSKFKIPDIDLIAVTNGPGLEPALWTGINFAEDLAKKWRKPLIPINHMEGHLFSVFLKKNREKNFQFSISNLQFPAVALLVSGGHTELILVRNWLKYKILGQTRDDAAGEAFDKVAKMLELGYPGGPIVSKLASNYRGLPTGQADPTSIVELPRPMLNSKDYDLSFSGLKTAVLYKLAELKFNNMPNTYDRRYLVKYICHEFQQAVIDVLICKTMRAVKEFKAKTLIVAGGVAANKELRKQFEQKIKILPNTYDRKYLVKPILLLPELKFTGDNAAMIALTAYFRFKANKKRPALLQALKAHGNLKIA